MRILDIEKYFDKIYFSSDYYICKPDSKFFEQLISDLNLDIKKSIMIGNDPICDIKGAQSVGLDTLYIHSNLSPEIKHEFNPTYKVMNGDVNQISSLIIN
ncbi:Putative HAD-hydrolase YfnB [Clostridium neonatale]|uniref:HAD-hydrolase YfnB n=2 Tax=Clostridium TaxID=1485 RepID=A0A650MVA4_9CLOT|nr:Putative HAD-hydrolase YfnB [Clostridium neonatale]SUQ54175.1 Putative HAD-hydrolase YfnB [Clostridium neonatale]VCT86186.1 Putative HAD-hydrolase YfnB [Clostridium neonatale]